MKKFRIYFSYIALALIAALLLASCDLLFEDTDEGNPSEITSETPTETPTEDSAPITRPDVPTLADPTTPTEAATSAATEAATSAETSKPTSKPTETQTEGATQTATEGSTEAATQQPTSATTEAATEPVLEGADYAINFYNSGRVGISDESAVIVSGKIYKIVKPGIYAISGKMDDGQIRVEVEKTEKVTLLLNNFDGSNSTSAVIYVVSADKVEIDLNKNTVNVVTDAQTYIFDNPADDKPNACIYSSDDLEIKGGGELYVNGRYNNGIGCKNDIEIKNGKVHVSAVKNAIKGNDSVTICGDAYVEITHAKDAIKADTLATEKPDKGFIKVTDEAVVEITCADEALQATQNITVTSGATINIKSAKNTYKCDGTVNIDAGCIITGK